MATIRDPEELDAYRLAVALRIRVFAFTRKPQVARHFKFCDQIRESARSGPANLSEGLGRYMPRDNARFVRNAIASLYETRTHLGEAQTERHIEEQEYLELIELANRAIKAARGWHAYLSTCEIKPPGRPGKKKPGPKATQPPKRKPKPPAKNDADPPSQEDKPGKDGEEPDAEGRTKK
jgi:four helix bundle protein